MFSRFAARGLPPIVGVFLSLAAAVAAAPAWPHESSDLPPDPAIVWGRLENGLRYAVRSHAEPAGRVSLRLLVTVGSLQERDDQRGYAHYVEHMAFNGTRRFPAGTLVETLQRHGMAIGAEVSAFTNAMATFYMINLAGNSDTQLHEGFAVLRDFADGIQFGDREIRKERGVILSEKRARDSGATRIEQARTELLYPEALLARRSPIGTEAAIRGARRSRLIEFYETWYRPERMVVIAVGDASPERLEAAIRQEFASLAARRPPAPSPDPGRWQRAPGLQVALRPEMEGGGGVSAEISSVTARKPQPDSRAERRRLLARTAAFAILEQRLHAEMKREAGVLGQIEARSHEVLGWAQEAYVRVDSRPLNWRRALATAEQELRRVLEHGLTESEVREVTASGLAAFQHAARSAPTRSSEQLAQQMLFALMNDRVVITPEEELALTEATFSGLTPAECLDAFREVWSPTQRTVLVFGNLRLDRPDADLLAAYQASAEVPVAPPQTSEAGSFAYETFGPPGSVRSQQRVEDLDVHLVEFTNGVRVNLKATSFEANTVQLSLRWGRGLSSEPVEQPGLGWIAGSLFMDGGLGRHDSEALRRILAGRTLRLQFTVEDDAFVFYGSASSADLPLLLHVATAYLLDPAWSPQALQHARGQWASHYSRLAGDAESLAQTLTHHVLTGQDSRYGPPPFDELMRRTMDEVRIWLEPTLRRAPLEMTLVGDFTPEEALDWAAATVGTLPSRDPDHAGRARPINPPTPPGTVRQAIPPASTKAAVWVSWLTPGLPDVRLSRRIHLLNTILVDRVRVKVREELGSTYAPIGNNWESAADPRFGYFFVALTARPAEANRLAGLIQKIADDLARHGVTADEFERARQPRLAMLDQDLRHNGYWLHVLSRAQERPERLDWPRSRHRDYQMITKTEIDAEARRCLGNHRAFTVIVSPP